MVFTDVEGSTPLWERHPDAMRAALATHDGILRGALGDHGGYEMRTEGDAFKAAFSDPSAAISWCMDVQRRLHRAEWPPELLHEGVTEDVTVDGTTVLRGLRVRMGAHIGWPDCRVHPTTARMDYDGPMVNTTARIAAAPHGGQVVVSEELWKTAGHGLTHLLVRDLGGHAFRGVREPLRLFQLLPPELAGRSFGPLHATPAGGATVGSTVDRRLVTALCVVVDAKAGPDGLLDVAVEELQAAASRLEGTVHPLDARSFAVVFGERRATEDHAERAARTALELRELFGPLRAMISEREGGMPTLCAAIATVEGQGYRAGEAAVTAAKDGVVPDRITVSPQTRMLLGGMARGAEGMAGWLDLERLDPTARIRGVPGLCSPLVGRDREMEVLVHRASALHAGKGAVVVVSGEPGVGKSRLASELRQGLGDQVRWLEGRCSSSQRDAYGPWMTVLRSLLALPTDDRGVVARTGLRVALRGLHPASAERFAPVLASVLGLDLGAGWSAPEPAAVGGLMADALRTLLPVLGPTVLLIEDLHWIDAASLDLLHAATQTTDLAPVLVLVTMRPDADSPAWDYALDVARNYRHRQDEIRLEALDPDAAERLTRNLLDLAELPGPLRKTVLDRCGGNPLFLEEILRTLVQRGAIVREDQRWMVRATSAPVEIPTTVRGVIDARIDGLPERVRATLQHAAVLGRSFDRATLSALMDGPDDLDRCLGHLQRVDLVRQEVAGPAGVSYAFKAALTRESAYARLAEVDRCALHRRAATEIEHRAPDPTGERASSLAHHYQRAGDPVRAIHHAMRAVNRADQLHAREQAVLEYWRILDLVAQLPPSEDTRTRQLEAVLGLLSLPGWARGADEQARGLRALDEALETARGRRDAALLAKLESIRGLRTKNEEAFERALSHAQSADDGVVEAVTRMNYGDYLGAAGMYEKAFEQIDRSIGLYGESGDERGQAMSMASTGRCYCARAGRLAQSLEYASRAREIGEKLDDRRLQAWRAMEAEPYLYLGRWDDVVRVTEEGIPVAIEVGARFPWLFAASWAAIGHVELGQPERAEAVLGPAEQESDAHAGTDFPRVYLHIARASLELARDDVPAARTAAEAAIRVARRGGYRLDEGAALRTLARVHAAGGDRAAAIEAFESSLGILREIESRPELGQTLLHYGRLLIQIGDPRGAEMVEDATQTFEAIGADGWLARARDTVS